MLLSLAVKVGFANYYKTFLQTLIEKNLTHCIRSVKEIS